MQIDFSQKVAQELGLALNSVKIAASLMDEGATIPFVARYRKEATGNLDEVALTSIRDRIAQLKELEARREAILESLTERNLLTDELKEKIENALTLTKLEDIYLPFRPKRRTRATIAKEKGLEPLADKIFSQIDGDVTEWAKEFIDAEKEVNTAEDALSGARDIIAEKVHEDETARQIMRKFFFEQAKFVTKVITGKEEEGAKFKDYFEWSEPVDKAPSHRVLAMRRGEKEGFLILRVSVPEEEAIEILSSIFVKQNNPAAMQTSMAAADSFKRLMSLSMETEVRMETKKRADAEAIKVFSKNLREILMASPLGHKTILALDPGFRTGCKTVCLDKNGKLLADDVVFVVGSDYQKADAKDKLRQYINKFNVEVIAIGNGTASRETESFVKELNLNIPIIMVNESGASVYSASEVAREEFPDKDVTVRGAVSIGRRLMDPLAELVKIDPKSIGVGQYQHDVDQTQLKNSLDDVVISCVNNVGVDVNTASKQLLTYVSGLGAQLAKNIVEYRNENGAFKTRNTLKKVARLGPKAFEQCAGFLRISNAENPLDSSAVHPERYELVETIAKDLDTDLKSLIGNEAKLKTIDLQKYVTDEAGILTLQDIVKELAKPGRDPRKQFEIFSFADIHTIEDAKPGMKVPAVITNVTAFGAFADIGVHQDGLIHISEMADVYVSDPANVVKVGDKIKVTITDVDVKRKRIALSMKTNPVIGPKEPKGQGGPSAPREQKPRQDNFRKENDRPRFDNNKGLNSAMADAFKNWKKN